MKPRADRAEPLTARRQREICNAAREDIFLTLTDLAARFECTVRQAQMALIRNGIKPVERLKTRPVLGDRRRSAA